MFEIPSALQGILPVQWLRQAAEEGVIRSKDAPIPESNFQPASLDLRLGEKAYRLRCSFLPDTHDVQAKLDDHMMEEFDISNGAILESGRPYLIPLIEELSLPPDIRARTNPRSSTGRVDVFTRVITDKCHRFDEVAAGYHGKLYLEVVSRSFTIKVQSGLRLNQLRLFRGKSQFDDQEILELHQDSPLVLFDRGQLPLTELDVADGLFLSVDLIGDGKGVVGYKAKKNSKLVDLSKQSYYESEDFWEPIYGDRMHRLVLEPEEFYLLLSSEGVRIPPHVAAEMTALDPTSGEFRTHYAGFFDPGFGYDPQGMMRGTRAVMEVRAHDVPFMIQDRQRVCKLRFEKMLERPDILYGSEIGSSYQDQGLTLSKHFIPMNLPENPRLTLH